MEARRTVSSSTPSSFLETFYPQASATVTARKVDVPTLQPPFW